MCQRLPNRASTLNQPKGTRKGSNNQRTTLNRTVFSSDFGRINRRRSDNVLNTKIKLCLRFVPRLERRKPEEIQRTPDKRDLRITAELIV